MNDKGYVSTVFFHWVEENKDEDEYMVDVDDDNNNNHDDSDDDDEIYEHERFESESEQQKALVSFLVVVFIGSYVTRWGYMLCLSLVHIISTSSCSYKDS